VEADFGEFVAARSAALFRTALLLTGNRDTADDLVQGTLEKACRTWPRAGRADSPDAYVRRILVNQANDRWRRLGRRGIALPLLVERTDPVDHYERTDQRDLLMRALHTLPLGMRTVLVFRYFEDLPDADIAALLDVSVVTVRSQASRGLAKLRAAVLGAGGDELHEGRRGTGRGDDDPARTRSGGDAS